MPNRTKEDHEWSDKVVEQFQDSIDNLPAIDEPSGYQKRLIHGSALINSGALVADAARAVGVEYHRLLSFHNKDLKTIPPDVKAHQENIIREQAVQGLTKAQERIIKMLDDDDMRPAEVIKAAQTLRDTVSTLDNWKERGTGGAEETKNALQDLVAGVLNRLPKPDPVEEAIEVKGDSHD